MESLLITVVTGARLVTDITAPVTEFCRSRGDGLASIFVPHATAGLALLETGSGTEKDLETVLEEVLPRDVAYRHRHGSPGHGRDHVLPAVISPSVVIPVLDGALQLGTWQSIVLVDPNVDNPERTVRVSFLADSRAS